MTVEIRSIKRKMFNVRLDSDLIDKTKQKAKTNGKYLYSWVEDALRMKIQYEEALETKNNTDQAPELRKIMEEQAV